MVIRSHQSDEPAVDLEIALAKVCFIIIKGREFEVKEESSDDDSGSNPVDDAELDVLEESPDDPVEEEITSLIDELTVDEQIDLVALNWLGRDEDNTATDWPELRRQAAEAHNDRTSQYLIGDPMLPDNLEAGLAALGLSCADYEEQHL
ncbi:MAG: DUF3775 domain-containing protein [Salaquimonas sp.]|nr:DUF3775 domain-containing protein [Salaquimonas sp.]